MADDDRQELGRRGEQFAAEFLRLRGLRILARRFRTPVGELDLVCDDRGTVVFVEVKSQSDDRLCDPQDRLNVTKRRRLLKAARWFIHGRRLASRPCRFDVVTVILTGAGAPRIRHFADSFLPERE